MSKADAVAISRRLNDFVHRRYGTWRKFEKTFKVPRTTRIGWSHRTDPTVPEIPYLLRLARDKNLNLNWLLLGDLPELRERPADSPAERIRAAIEAELRQSEDATSGEFEAAWDRMMLRGDWSKPDDEILKLAVDGVRPSFQENLRLVRHYAGLVRVYEALRKAMMIVGTSDPKRAERIGNKLDELLADSPTATLESLAQLAATLESAGPAFGH